MASSPRPFSKPGCDAPPYVGPATLRRRACELLTAALAVLLAAPCGSAESLDEEALRETVTQALNHAEKSHYSNVRVDDRISQLTLENYVAALDGLRIFFTVEDEELLREQYGDRLDDALREKQMYPMFDIHSLYLRRHAEFLALAQIFLKTRPNLNTSREWRRDRLAVLRPANQAEQEKFWRDWLRHEWINLVLEGRSYEAAGAWLRHHYRFADPVAVDEAGFSFSLTLAQSPVAEWPDADAHDSKSAIALFLNSFAFALDANSGYVSPESVREFSERLEEVGQIPVSLALDGEHLVVRERPGKEIVATQGGLQAGDRMIGLDPFGDGEVIDVVGWEPFEVHKLMFGPAGTTVVFRVLPAGGQTEVMERKMERSSFVTEEMKRALRWTPKWLIRRGMKKKLESAMRAEKKVLEVQLDGQTRHVGVIRIRAMDKNCERDVKRLAEELKAEGVDGLVLDLRDNTFGGGDEVVSLTGLFVGKGPISQQRDRKGKLRVQRNSKRKAIWEGPLAVLVNRRSSAASEVLAAAIQDFGRGVVVGKSTGGNGARHSEYKIKSPARDNSEDATLRITTREVYRVTGDRIHLEGVTPDISLPAGDEAWSMMRTPGSSSLPYVSLREQIPGNLLPAYEIPAPDVRRRNKSLLPLDELISRHEGRESQEPAWRLMSDRVDLSRRSMENEIEPIHIEQRRKNQDFRREEELELARAWLEAQGSEASAVEPAQAEYLQQFRASYLPESSVVSAANEPALVRAMMLARGIVVVPDENGFRLDRYDLPLQKTALIVADLAQLQ